MFILVVSNDGVRAEEVRRELDDQGLDWRLEWTDAVASVLSGERVPDVLVCAEDLGTYSGIALLAQMRTRHPETMRILLTMPGEQPDSTQAMEVAQRVLPEPLDALALIDAVESAAELRTLLDDPAFDVLLTGESRFDELPEVMAGLAAGSLQALCHTITYGEG